MIHPVILCGGGGTRLWPLSRKDYPKQFANLFGDESLFQAAVLRGFGRQFAPPMVLTHADFRFLVADQLAAVGQADATILLEPEGRNTAPAVLSAALQMAANGHGDGIMLVMPSDHVITAPEAFLAALPAAKAAADQGALVTFGVRPDRAETGYGYLEVDAVPEAFGMAAVPVRRFVEKPDAVRADAMWQDGRHLWNAGIFMFRARNIIDAVAQHAGHLMEDCQSAVARAQVDLGFLRLCPDAYLRLTDESLDTAVMERAHHVVTVPLDCGWSDLGAWDAVWREMDQNAQGVATSGPVTDIGCATSLLRSDEDGPHLVGVNLDGIAVIAMNDAVLVADMSDLQAVKDAVTQLKGQRVRQATSFPRQYKPWGWYETLALADRYQVKQIVLPPGRKMSLQSHMHRSEHWIVVAGTATVTIGDEITQVTENQSVYIPVGQRHRLENAGKIDLHLIEVQTGGYLGEDDIIRYEDVYNRA